MQPNPIDVVERAYRLDGTEREWLEQLARTVYPLLDGGMGLVGYIYDLRFPAAVWWQNAIAVDAPDAQVIVDSAKDMPADEVYTAHVAPGALDTMSCFSQRMGLTEIPAFLTKCGASDAMALRTVGPGDRGLVLSAMQRTRRGIDRRTKGLWAKVSAHVASGLRLRDGVEQVDAVITTAGKLEHAEGQVKLPSVRERLRDAVKRQEHARGRARRENPEGATEMWTALVAGQWSLVDHFETGGRRYIVARRNPLDCRDPRALGERERAVANLAALGKPNKLIAYELGIAESTVATHLSAAMRKLGVKSRVELLRHLPGGR